MASTVDERLSAARRAADAQLAEARAQAQREAGLIVADHQAQASAIAQQARESVELELHQALQSESQVVESLARTMLERAVGPELVA